MTRGCHPRLVDAVSADPGQRNVADAVTGRERHSARRGRLCAGREVRAIAHQIVPDHDEVRRETFLFIPGREAPWIERQHCGLLMDDRGANGFIKLAVVKGLREPWQPPRVLF